MSQFNLWHNPPRSPLLAAEEVHVWRAFLDLPESSTSQLEMLLSSDERARAKRLYFEKDRRHFVSARAVLRLILSSYLGAPPQLLSFRYGQHGKPELAIAPDKAQLSFNLSHSNGLALYAITCNRAVGIDVEHIRPFDCAEEIAERYFAPSEYAALHTLAPALRLTSFFTCWTRKEAFVKARGEGLAYPLNQFAVTLAPGHPAALLQSADLRDLTRWALQELVPGAGYVATLAVEGHDWRLRRWQWPCVPSSLALLQTSETGTFSGDDQLPKPTYGISLL